MRSSCSLMSFISIALTPEIDRNPSGFVLPASVVVRLLSAACDLRSRVFLWV